MAPSSIKKIDYFLAGLSQRHTSSMNMQVLSQRNAVWKQCVEPLLAEHVRVAFYNEGRLVLHADASVWCNKLLHMQQTLVRRLRQHPIFRDLTGLHIRVVPLTRGVHALSPPAQRLSTRAADIIASAAEDIGDPDLGEALKRLARRTRD